MMEYYGETLAMASDEIAKYTDQMDHAASVLDHYSSIMSLLGKDKDYKAMEVILKGQATMAQNAYEVSKKSAEMYAIEAEARKKAYEDAKANNTTTAEELELLEKNWLEA